MEILLQHPIVRGALAGIVAAVIIDYRTFMRWRSWDEALAYDWKLASFRIIQGAIGGIVAAVAGDLAFS